MLFFLSFLFFLVSRIGKFFYDFEKRYRLIDSERFIRDSFIKIEFLFLIVSFVSRVEGIFENFGNQLSS